MDVVVLLMVVGGLVVLNVSETFDDMVWLSVQKTEGHGQVQQGQQKLSEQGAKQRQLDNEPPMPDCHLNQWLNQVGVQQVQWKADIDIWH